MSKESLGIINWWGFTPAIDLLDDGIFNYNSIDEINILLIGSGDSRHILKTISKLYNKNIQNINFFVIESGIELYARYILQLLIALIPLNILGLQDKTEIFLELFGNSLVREQSMDLARKIANELIRLITDPELCVERLPFLDLGHLKFKELDILEHVFKIWRSKENRSFDANLSWDLRVRQHLGVRYDAIPNVFDWDCSMTLHDRGADIVHSREYGRWRLKGVAFELRDASYDVSNRTLASGRLLLTPSGDRTVRLGYWGDIVCSPYLAFGIRGDCPDLFKKMNNQYICGSQRVSEYNVSEMMHEIAYQIPYVEKKTTESKCVTITEVTEEEEETKDPPVPGSTSVTESLLAVPGGRVRVVPLPLAGLAGYMTRKSSFCDRPGGFFQIVHVSASLLSELDPSRSGSGGDAILKLLGSNSCIVADTPRFVVSLDKTQVAGFETKLDQIMTELHCQKSVNQPDNIKETGHIIYERKC